MKRTTNIIGYLTALSIAIYTVFKFCFIPGAWFLMIITGIFLSIYFAALIIEKQRETSGGKTLPVHIVGALCASVLTLAVLCNFQRWAASGILFLIGLLGFSFIFLPMLFLHKSKQPEANNLMNGAGVIGLAVFALAIVSKMERWSGAEFLFVAGPVLIFFVYFPMYIWSSTISAEKKATYLRNAFFVIIAGFLLFLFVFGIIMHWKVTMNYTTT